MSDGSNGDAPHRERQQRKGIKRRDLLLSGSTLVAASALAATGLTRSAKAELLEYKPGQAFPGVIGRTFDVSKPAWPAPTGRGKARRTCCSSSSTIPASGSLVVTAVRSTRPT